MAAIQKIHSFDGVFDSQKVYRLILTAMSNPTRVVSIKSYADKLFGRNPEFLALALTLLDNEVSFHTCDDTVLTDEISSLTLSRPESLENADFIFVPEEKHLAQVIKHAKCGTLKDPHKSATVIVKVSGRDTCDLHLYGAGIRNTTEFQTDALVQTALDLRDEQYYEYPQGIDLIFVAENGDLFAIPRLTLREAE